MLNNSVSHGVSSVVGGIIIAEGVQALAKDSGGYGCQKRAFNQMRAAKVI